MSQLFLQKISSCNIDKQKLLSYTEKNIELTNRFAGKAKNLLDEQKNFVSSISTIRLANTTIFFLCVN